jgi:alpha-ketoglutarate-dependent taurine dioxygenase
MREIWDYAAGREDLVYAHHWAPGDLVVWHNCLTQHARLPFNGSEPRTLRRTQIHYPGTYHG